MIDPDASEDTNPFASAAVKDTSKHLSPALVDKDTEEPVVSPAVY